MTEVNLQSLNEFFNKNFADLIPRQPSYKFWTDKRGSRYFYTTEAIIINGKKRYISGIYRRIKSKKIFVLRKRVNHAKKKDAIKRAYKLYKEVI